MIGTDIRKSGGVIIRNRKLLVTRSFGKDFFIAPGGKLEDSETPIEALKREIYEELQVKIEIESLEHLGTFRATAAEKQNTVVEMYVYVINKYSGKIVPSGEIEAIRWIDSNTSDVQIGSIFEHDVVPILKQRDLID